MTSHLLPVEYIIYRTFFVKLSQHIYAKFTGDRHIIKEKNEIFEERLAPKCALCYTVSIKFFQKGFFMKRTVALLLLTVLLFSVCACGKSNTKTLTQDEFSITLSDDYGMVPHISYFVSYETADKKAVLVTRNKKDIVEEVAGKPDISLLEYANLVIQTNRKGEDPKTKDGVTYYTYTSHTDGVDYTYLATVHKSENAFWLVQFVCETKEYNDMEDTFFGYAKSVSIKE